MNPNMFKFINDIETNIGLILATIIKTVIGSSLRYIILFVPHYIWRNNPNYFSENITINVQNIMYNSHTILKTTDHIYSCVGKNSFITNLIKETVVGWNRICYKFSYITTFTQTKRNVYDLQSREIHL